ncbi:hypothetical protein DFS33DRAFT_1334540 [Desarmillaria ectypa]|nr:hypothetical protein DFS33DRAFT_1334540 [Desarmillaria ectypa]
MGGSQKVAPDQRCARSAGPGLRAWAKHAPSLLVALLFGGPFLYPVGDRLQDTANEYMFRIRVSSVASVSNDKVSIIQLPITRQSRSSCRDGPPWYLVSTLLFSSRNCFLLIHACNPCSFFKSGIKYRRCHLKGCRLAELSQTILLAVVCNSSWRYLCMSTSCLQDLIPDAIMRPAVADYPDLQAFLVHSILDIL